MKDRGNWGISAARQVCCLQLYEIRIHDIHGALIVIYLMMMMYKGNNGIETVSNSHLIRLNYAMIITKQDVTAKVSLSLCLLVNMTS